MQGQDRATEYTDFDLRWMISSFWLNGRVRALAVDLVAPHDSNNTSLEYSFHNGLGHLMGTVDENGLLTTAFADWLADIVH